MVLLWLKIKAEVIRLRLVKFWNSLPTSLVLIFKIFIMQITTQYFRTQQIKIRICRSWEMNFRKFSRTFFTMTLITEMTHIYDQIKKSKLKLKTWGWRWWHFETFLAVKWSLANETNFKGWTNPFRQRWS